MRFIIKSTCAYVCCLLLSQFALADDDADKQPIASAPFEIPQATLTLDQALALALSGNPGLSAMQARARALADVPSQVGALPDPTLSLGALSLPTDTFSWSQEAMTQKRLGIGLTLPFPGKLGLREAVAELQAQTGEFDVAEKKLVLARSVRFVWWNLVYVDHAISLVQRNRSLLREFVKIAEAKYKTGQGMQSDVLLAQVELSKMLEREIALHAARRNQAAALNALLARPAQSEVHMPAQVDENLPIPLALSPLIEAAKLNRPFLATRRNSVEVASLRAHLAEKDYYPDFRLGAAYGFRDGNNPNGSTRADMTSLTLSINLPIFVASRQRKALSQRHNEMQKEEYSLQDSLLQVQTEIEQALVDFHVASEQASLYKSGIIPQSSQAASSMLASYQVNKVDFLNLVRAQITLYNYEAQYWKTISSAWQAWARLQAAVGVAPESLFHKDAALINNKDNSHE